MSAKCTLPSCDCIGICRASTKARQRRFIPARHDPVHRGPCPYCGIAMRYDSTLGEQPTRDHVEPKRRGGSDCESNILLCCDFCNQLKHDRTLEEWIISLEATGDVGRAMRVRKVRAERADQAA